MSIFSSIGAALGSSLSTALASKGAVAAGAAVLMVGGGVAVAQSGPGLDHADEKAEADLTSLVPFYGDEENGDVVELDVDEVTTNDNGENGENETTSERVHDALTGGADDEGDAIGPGHPDFGATVAERAQEEHLGEIVSEAARGDNGTNGNDYGNDNGTEAAQTGEGAAPSETPAEQSPDELPDEASEATADLPEEAPDAPPEHAPGPPEEPGPGN